MKRNIILVGLLVAFIITGLLAGTGSEKKQRKKSDAVTSASAKWLPPPEGYTYNVTLVQGIEKYIIIYNPQLYRGSDITLTGAKRLKTFGINTFITLDPEQEQIDIAKKAGLKVISFPFHGKIIPPPDLDGFLEILRDNKGAFYIHSTETDHRAGAWAAVYRLHIDKWTYEQAIIEFGRVGGSLKSDHLLIKSIRKKQVKHSNKHSNKQPNS